MAIRDKILINMSSRHLDMVNRKNVILASLGTIAITLTGGLLATVFSPVFSPLSEQIKNSITGNPVTNITNAMTFDSFNKNVSKKVNSGDTIASNSITFYFTSYLSPKDASVNVKPNYDPKFECSIDGNEYEPCVSPKSYSNLNSEAGHTFHVRSSGILGNVDTEPDEFHFTTITAATVKGVVKNNSTVIPNIDYLIDGQKSPSGQTLNSKGIFRLEGIGQGNHKLLVYLNSKDSAFETLFFVPGGRQEVLNLDFDVNDMSPSSVPPSFNVTNSDDNNTSFKPSIENIALNNKSMLSYGNSTAITTPNFTDYHSDSYLSNILEHNKSNLVLEDSLGEPKESTLAENASEINLGQSSIRINNPQNPFSTRIWINTTDAVLSTIDKVDYYLHPTFTPNVVTSSLLDNQFEISFTNWGFFNLNAKVFFKDGSIKDLLLPRGNWKT